MEVWKDIAGYEGLYQVSNLGRVRSLDRYVPHKRAGQIFRKGCMMATHENNAGYLTVNLCKENKYRSFDIHRLVAVAFIESSLPDAVEVNHKDENKHNNCVDNLEWVTRHQNVWHGTARARQRAKVNRPVLQYDTEGNFIKEWDSATIAELNISGKFTGAISHNIKGKTKTAFGCIWRFKEVT